MPLILSGNVASATAGAYEVANSCRFNDGDSADMNRTFGTPTLATKYTISLWVKRSTITSRQIFFKTSGYMYFEFQADDKLHYIDQGTGGDLVTSRLFRDPSAWYHVCLRVDNTLGTADDRHKIYVNGTQETSFDDRTNPTQNNSGYAFKADTASYVGSNESSNLYFDGYMAEFVGIDGLALAPTSFGEFDEDSPTIWKPKDVSGLTFGTNGFYLDFEDSANLGNDANGGTDWTENNLAATDQATDTPTNNFCTINPLTTTNSRWTISEGNCKLANNQSGWSPSTATIGVTSGKWYCEVKCTAVGDASVYGIMDFAQYDDGTLEMSVYSRAWIYRAATGYYHNNDAYGAGTSYGDSFTTNDIIGIYLDLDNNKVYWAKNGTLQNSGTGISITDGYDYTFAFNMYNVGGDATTYNVCEVNFGNPTWSLSSAVADANGYGSFEYNPSSGTFDSASKDFYALCTKNLAEFGG